MTVTNMLRDLILQHVNSDMFTDDGRCEWDWEEIKKERGTGVIFNMFGNVMLS